ncbi:hypothetical protein [Fundidesulfovibrio agrisoli]|uniref:hypothetical protein n=1 Tax=Fundidesulfovibrio agrisoli TaxID=2922717 RepID=UPI001FAE4676|nr:hypothetical protein [Fundidesulfovibrio agrisoli]
MVSDWALQAQAEREKKLEYIADNIDLFEFIADNFQAYESAEARIDMLESMVNSLQKTIPQAVVRDVDENLADIDMSISSTNIKRGVAAYGLKMLGKTNREIAAILWPKQEYSEARHGRYIRRDVAQAKEALAGLSSVLPQDK